jgi:hypothetical protein
MRGSNYSKWKIGSYNIFKAPKGKDGYTDDEIAQMSSWYQITRFR